MSQGNIQRLYRKTEVPFSGCGNLFIPAWAYTATPTGTWAIQAATVYIYNYILTNTSTNDGDAIDYQIYLEEGFYTFTVIGVIGTVHGNMELLIDGVSYGTINCYTVNTTYNIKKVWDRKYITEPGFKTLRIRANGKDASSGDYTLSLNYITIKRLLN